MAPVRRFVFILAMFTTAFLIGCGSSMQSSTSGSESSGSSGSGFGGSGSGNSSGAGSDIGVATYQLNTSDGSFTQVPNGFFLLTNSEVGGVNSLAITK